MAAPSSSNKKIKFHYSYGGKIMWCEKDVKLHYVGGTNKIMAVDRGISYTELIVKLWDACGPSMCLRCKLPNEDLDCLVHVSSDKDLADVIEEYDWTGKDLKIRAILDPLPSPITKVVDDYLGHKVAQFSSLVAGCHATSILSCTPTHGRIR
ncbi:hypothetical protein L2E82_32038 [Cichorium intybus]|uniref:Uncharacterized protein n=1 Tax=Cichorium intybus TaxID=13427 RepID=A0ACB9BGE6_CICIN|nr:hypothetical protein L1887_08972 [Cichorium endivia]KAI3721035.1 hypothetical protein L2E82_32038 [Cichorium intybus]